MADRVQNVTIVGGGTAGWLTACIIHSFLNRRKDKRPVNVTLIESPNTPIIGVGEATVPGMVRLLKQLNIDETRFFRECNSSFKLGVKFVDWNRSKKGNPQSFVHPFQAAPYIDGFPVAYYYHAFAKGDFVDETLPQMAAIDNVRAPRELGAKDYESLMSYAYHLDAGKFAGFLRDVSVERGVTHVLDDLVDVEIGENGRVDALHFERTGRREVELVIDCTGFRGLIMRKALGEPRVSWNNHLLNDTALAVQIDHDDRTHLEPYTRSTALGAGWVWNVPLYNRIGTGYVYSSAFRTEEQATEEFLAHLGPRAKGKTPRAIKMEVGRSQRGWVGNCVAIGLSGGFIEPLESTAIYMIEMAARWVVDLFPDAGISEPLPRRYNQRMDGLYNEVRDFVMLHYLLSNRTGDYWEAARNEVDVSDWLKNNLEVWKYTLPYTLDVAGNSLFNEWNFIFVLMGKRYYAGRELSMDGLLDAAKWQEYTDMMTKKKQAVMDRMPTHYQLLAKVHGEIVEETKPTKGEGTDELLAAFLATQPSFTGSTHAATTPSGFDPDRFRRGPTVKG